jgi:putative toxin-antitoxin system antitoxin component (TIGR02293 family)
MRQALTKIRDGKGGAGHSSRRMNPRGFPGLVHNYIFGPSGKISGKTIAQRPATAKMIASVKGGLPVYELNELQTNLDVPMDKLALKLGISKATLHRRKTQGRLDPAESDRVVRFARLMGKAVKLFGGVPEARQWLNTPQFGLDGVAPLDFAETEIGAREVENLLGRIEYGVYS